MTDRATRTALLLVLAVAAVLRFWALDHGLPFTMARPDEAEALLHTRGFPSGDLNPRWFVYPNLFFWLIWVWDAACLAVRGLSVATPSYVAALDTNLPLLLFDGRILSALVGTATVLVTYRLGRRVEGPATGLAAAALLAVNFLLHGQPAQDRSCRRFPICGRFAAVPRRPRYAPPSVRASRSASRPRSSIRASCSSLRPGTRRRPGRRRVKRLIPHRSLAVVVGVAVLAFIAGCPRADRPRAPRRHVHDLVLLVYGVRPEMLTGIGHGPLSLALAFVRSRSFEYNLTVGLRHGAGLAFALASPIAIVAALVRGTPSLLRCAAITTVVYYLIISLSQVELARYLTPIMPLLALLVGSLVVSVSRVAGGAGRAR
jgi:hypothetical protein